MPKKTLIITSLIVAVIAIAATAIYITLKQGGEKVKVTTPEKPFLPEKPVAQPKGPTTTQPEEPTQPTTTEPIDTSNWKTYRNEKYGFEVKYPSWYEGVTGCQPFIIDSGRTVFIGPMEFRIDDLKKMSFEEFVRDKVQPPGPEAPETLQKSYKLQSKEDIQFLGFRAVKIIRSFCTISCYNPTTIYVDRGNIVLEISYDDGIINQCPIDRGSINEWPSETASQILSTFRFIETNETTGWRTYRNEKYGFEVRYPSIIHLAKKSNRKMGSTLFFQRSQGFSPKIS